MLGLKLGENVDAPYGVPTYTYQSALRTVRTRLVINTPADWPGMDHERIHQCLVQGCVSRSVSSVYTTI